MSTYADQLRDLQEKQLTPAESEEAAFNKLLGYNIAAARAKRQLSQEQLATTMGITQSAWSRKEQGQSSITVYDLMVAAKVLNRRVQDLIPT